MVFDHDEPSVGVGLAMPSVSDQPDEMLNGASKAMPSLSIRWKVPMQSATIEIALIIPRSEEMRRSSSPFSGTIIASGRSLAIQSPQKVGP